MAEIKIRVATHDNDTTEVDLALKDTTLELTLGKNKASVELSSIVPQSQADRFLAEASYDKRKKELVLITRKEGEADQEIRIPIADIFKVEIEEVWTMEEKVSGTEHGLTIHLGHPYAQTVLKANKLGRIKGTDWLVFQFPKGQLAQYNQELERINNLPPYNGSIRDVNFELTHIHRFEKHYSTNKRNEFIIHRSRDGMLSFVVPAGFKPHTVPTAFYWTLKVVNPEVEFTVHDAEVTITFYPEETYTGEKDVKYIFADGGAGIPTAISKTGSYAARLHADNFNQLLGKEYYADFDLEGVISRISITDIYKRTLNINGDEVDAITDIYITGNPSPDIVENAYIPLVLDYTLNGVTVKGKEYTQSNAEYIFLEGNQGGRYTNLNGQLSVAYKGQNISFTSSN